MQRRQNKEDVEVMFSASWLSRSFFSPMLLLVGIFRVFILIVSEEDFLVCDLIMTKLLYVFYCEDAVC